MTGIISTLHHIIPILAIYFIIILIVVFVKGQVLKTQQEIEPLVTQISKIIFRVLTAGTILMIIIVLGFLSNPFEREQIKTISPAIINQEFKFKSSNEIVKINEEVVNKKHIEKEAEAIKNNQKAVEDSKNIFK